MRATSTRTDKPGHTVSGGQRVVRNGQDQLCAGQQFGGHAPMRQADGNVRRKWRSRKARSTSPSISGRMVTATCGHASHACSDKAPLAGINGATTGTTANGVLPVVNSRFPELFSNDNADMVTPYELIKIADNNNRQARGTAGHVNL